MSLVTPREPAARQTTPAALITTQQARRTQRWSQLVLASASSAGKRHVVNEDSHSELGKDSSVFVVADGVGGGAMAAFASREVVKRLHAALGGRSISAATVRTALVEADRYVGRGIARRTGRSGATTVALCASTGAFLSRWFIGWVGDCRIYRLCSAAGPGAQLLTRDDTYRNLRERPPHGGSLDDPARMVGNGAVGEPNVERIELRCGESLMLCSDGVYKHVTTDEMVRALDAPMPLAQCCRQLVDAARANGSVDDATVLVVRRDRHPSRLLWRHAGAGAIALLLSAVVFALVAHTDASSVPPVTTLQSPIYVESQP
jgi:protein phosphatase